MWFALILAILVKLLIETENPRLCAGFYATLVLVAETIALLTGYSTWYRALLTVLLALSLSYAYFWVLDRIETGSLPWWVVLLGGALAAFFL